MMEYRKPVFPERHTAVVSGAGAPRGIARRTARRLAEEGWDLVVVDLSDKVLEFGEELADEFPDRKSMALRLDISDEEQVKDAFARIEETMPPVVGLANIAGIACPVPLLELDADLFDKVLAVNCRGTMLMMKYAAERMRKQGIGRIVNFSSITALDGGGTFSKFAYAAAVCSASPREAPESSAPTESRRTRSFRGRSTRTSWAGGSRMSASSRCPRTFRWGGSASRRR